MSGEIQSIGREGMDFQRPEGRAYYNVEQTVQTYQQLAQLYESFSYRGKNEFNRRRIVLRARCTQEVVQQLTSAENTLPLEVLLPLSSIDSQHTDSIITLGENIHPTTVPEWPHLLEYWKHPNGNGRTPQERTQRLSETPFRLTNELLPSDASTLAKIWEPFGWTIQGVKHFISTYRQQGKFFSGVIDQSTGQLVSACMAERMTLAGVQMVEATEFGTVNEPQYRGHGLCTASVIGLHAQILNTQFYSQENSTPPLILAECSATTRSDIVARHTGMTVPFVEGNTDSTQEPIQVLKHNVSILDGQEINTISFQRMSPAERRQYRDAFKTTSRYWRNFIVAVLPRTSIDQDYSPKRTQEILSEFITRRESF